MAQTRYSATELLMRLSHSGKSWPELLAYSDRLMEHFEKSTDQNYQKIFNGSWTTTWPTIPLNFTVKNHKVRRLECALTEHKFLTEQEMFKSMSGTAPNSVFRVICTHCGCYYIEETRTSRNDPYGTMGHLNPDGSRHNPLNTGPHYMRTGPEGRMPQYWHEAQMHNTITERLLVMNNMRPHLSVPGDEFHCQQQMLKEMLNEFNENCQGIHTYKPFTQELDRKTSDRGVNIDGIF